MSKKKWLIASTMIAAGTFGILSTEEQRESLWDKASNIKVESLWEEAEKAEVGGVRRASLRWSDIDTEIKNVTNATIAEIRLDWLRAGKDPVKVNKISTKVSAEDFIAKVKGKKASVDSFFKNGNYTKKGLEKALEKMNEILEKTRKIVEKAMIDELLSTPTKEEGAGKTVTLDKSARPDALPPHLQPLPDPAAPVYGPMKETNIER